MSLAFFSSFSVVLLEEEQRDFLGVYPVVELVAHGFLVVGQTLSFLVAGVLSEEEQQDFHEDDQAVGLHLLVLDPLVLDPLVLDPLVLDPLVLDLSFLPPQISCYCF